SPAGGGGARRARSRRYGAEGARLLATAEYLAGARSRPGANARLRRVSADAPGHRHGTDPRRAAREAPRQVPEGLADGPDRRRPGGELSAPKAGRTRR